MIHEDSKGREGLRDKPRVDCSKLHSWEPHRTFDADMHDTKMPMKYSAIFHGCENNNLQMKYCDCFLIFAQNIDRG